MLLNDYNLCIAVIQKHWFCCMVAPFSKGNKNRKIAKKYIFENPQKLDMLPTLYLRICS